MENIPILIENPRSHKRKDKYRNYTKNDENVKQKEFSQRTFNQEKDIYKLQRNHKRRRYKDPEVIHVF